MTKHYTTEGNLLIRNSDIKDGYFDFGENPIYLEKSFAEENNTRMHQVGDVITVHTGDVGTSAVISENEVNSIGFATIVTRPNPKIIDSDYLATFLNTEQHKRWAVSISTGDGRTNYNLGDYYELVVPVPNIEEQKKIAEYIKNLNHLITLHQRNEIMILHKYSVQIAEKSCGFTYVWEQRKFSDLVIIERGGSPRPIEDFITDSADGLNWIKIGDAPEQGNYITKTAEKIRPEGLSKTREVHPGDLILSNSMSFGKPYIMGIDGCIHDGWLAIREVERNFDLKFLCTLLGTNQMLEQYRSFAAGSTVNNLNKELVGNTTVSYPNKDEQKQIGEYFEQLDHLITLHQRKYAYRFNNFMYYRVIYAWEQRKLEELGEISTGSTPSTSNSAYYSEDGIPWVTPTDINALTISDTPRKLSEEGAKVGRIVPANSILCTCIASIGKNTLLTVKGSFNQQINSLTPYNENDAYFLLTESEIWSNIMKRMAASGTMQIVNKTEFSELRTMVPSLAEQQQIGTYFHDLDTLITLHQRKLFARKWRKFYVKRSKKYGLLL